MQAVEDFLCVPRLTVVALERLRSVDVELGDVARNAGVRVPKGSENPYGLAEAKDAEAAGFLLRSSGQRLNSYCRQFGVSFAFVSFDVVPASDYESVFIKLSTSGAFVGIGLRYGLLMDFDPRTNDRHVLEVRAWSERAVELLDWTYDPALLIVKRAMDVERSARVDGDGFWVFERTAREG